MSDIGRLVGAAPVADVPVWAANPPIVAETPEEAAWLAKLHAGQGTLATIPEVGAVFDETGALVYSVNGSAAEYAAEPEATPVAAREARPWRGVDGAQILGKGDPAICMECLVSAASNGAVILERQ